MIIMGIYVSKTKRHNTFPQNVSLISINRVVHASDNLRKLIMVIIFMHSLENSKSCKFIVSYLAEISQLMHLAISLKLDMLMITHQTQQETLLENHIGSRKNLKNIVS